MAYSLDSLQKQYMKSSILTIAFFFVLVGLMAQPDTSKIKTTVIEKKGTKTEPDSTKLNKITVNEEGSKPMNKKGRNGRSSEGNTGTAERESKKSKKKSADDFAIKEED